MTTRSNFSKRRTPGCSEYIAFFKTEISLPALKRSRIRPGVPTPMQILFGLVILHRSHSGPTLTTHLFFFT